MPGQMGTLKMLTNTSLCRERLATSMLVPMIGLHSSSFTMLL